MKRNLLRPVSLEAEEKLFLKRSFLHLKIDGLLLNRKDRP